MLAPENLTTLLGAFAHGERGAADKVLPLIYDELQRIARRRRWQWGGGDSPGTNSLVHEVYIHLASRKQLDEEAAAWENRAHFFYFASVAMRNILVDHAKRLCRTKRGGEMRQVELQDNAAVSVQRGEELLALDEALAKLGEGDGRLAKIVECRFFGGLTVEETAEALSLSPASVKRGWDTARAWLFQQLREGR